MADNPHLYGAGGIPNKPDKVHCTACGYQGRRYGEKCITGANCINNGFGERRYIGNIDAFFIGYTTMLTMDNDNLVALNSSGKHF
jgi:hypothetical protein